MSAIDDGFFTHSRNVLNDSIMDFMHSTSDALITTLQPVLITALTIYFMCKAWSIMYGTGEGSMKQLTMQVIKMAFVTSMFCSTAYFYTNIAEPVYKLDEFFAPAVSANFKFKSENSYDALDKIYSNMLTNASTAVSKSWEEASKPKIMFVYAVLIFCTIFAVFIAFLILITNTLGLCFVLAFGPLFGCFLLFPQTKDLFNSWIKQCLTFVLTMVFVMAAINLMGQIIDNTVGLKEAPTSASFAGLAKAFHNTEGVGKLVLITDPVLRIFCNEMSRNRQGNCWRHVDGRRQCGTEGYGPRRRSRWSRHGRSWRCGGKSYRQRCRQSRRKSGGKRS